MSTQQEKQSAEGLLSRYAKVLNAADAAAIPSFYTQDGVFMPDGFKMLSVADLEKSGSSYLKKVNFQITYQVKNVKIDRDYAFVEAAAQTTIADISTGKESKHFSHDFFVLRNEGESWKIFRYIFNQVKA